MKQIIQIEHNLVKNPTIVRRRRSCPFLQVWSRICTWACREKSIWYTGINAKTSALTIRPHFLVLLFLYSWHLFSNGSIFQSLIQIKFIVVVIYRQATVITSEFCELLLVEKRDFRVIWKVRHWRFHRGITAGWETERTGDGRGTGRRKRKSGRCGRLKGINISP